MMKYFCDVCENEIADHNKATNKANTVERLGNGPNQPLQFEIMTGRNGTMNAGLFCKHCIIDAVKKLDDRPVVMAMPRPSFTDWFSEIARIAELLGWSQKKLEEFKPLETRRFYDAGKTPAEAWQAAMLETAP